MLKELKNETNVAYTWNGAAANKSTLNYILDLYARGGALRNVDTDTVLQLVDKAYATDKGLTIATIFYLGDIRGGQGERRFRRIALKYLAKRDPQTIALVLPLISEYGRWDDLMYALLDTPLEAQMVKMVHGQLRKDYGSERPSLLGKWLPSENAGAKTRVYARKMIKLLDFSPKEYRVMLSTLRAKINIIETMLANKEYKNLEYDKLPAGAYKKYIKAFYRNDAERFEAFTKDVKAGVKQVKSSTLYPYDILKLATEEGWSSFEPLDSHNREQADLLWKALPNYCEGVDARIMTIVDTSGSMFTGDKPSPAQVAISLGIYTAERLEGEYKNHFITFSSNPQLQEIVGTDLASKAQNLSKADWGGSTNIEGALDLILQTALKNNIPQSRVPNKLLIISDMQFNPMHAGPSRYNRGTGNKTLFDKIKTKWMSAGYEFPQIMFWCVNGRANNHPAKADDSGVIMVSGASPSILKYVLNGSFVTPMASMLEVLTSQRYLPVFDALGIEVKIEGV